MQLLLQKANFFLRNNQKLVYFISLQEKLQQRQMKQAQDDYKKEIEFLANKVQYLALWQPTFTLIDYRQRNIDALAKLKKGLKYKFLSGSEQTEQQLIQHRQILNSMFDEELLDPDSLNGEKKKEIAMVAQVTIQDVNSVIKQFKSMNNLHKWIREKKQNNEPLPEDQQELMYRFRQEKPMSKSFLKFEYKHRKFSALQKMQRVKWGARSV